MKQGLCLLLHRLSKNTEPQWIDQSSVFSTCFCIRPGKLQEVDDAQVNSTGNQGLVAQWLSPGPPTREARVWTSSKAFERLLDLLWIN